MADEALVRTIARWQGPERRSGGELRETLRAAKSLVQWLAILVGLVAVVGALSTMAR